MKRVVVALVLALLAVPAMAQVEIRGLTIAAPDKPGNGGIMLKSVISTRLPGEISALWRDHNEVFARISGQSHRLIVRKGELIHEPALVSEPKVGEMIVTDLDGDGDPEAVHVEEKDQGSRLVVSRWRKGGVDHIVTLASEKMLFFLGFAEMTRGTKPQIIYMHAPDYCLRLLSLQDQKLNEVGSLSCGAALTTRPVIADIDGDGRYDLIVAREKGRIEIFLR